MAKKKTELMEEENKKDFLDEESMEGERVFLMDEKGEILDAEEAERLESELLLKVDTYFMANPSLEMTASEQEDEEETTVVVDNEGNILEEETKKVITKGRIEFTSGQITIADKPATPSVFEEQLLIRVINKHIRELREGYERITDNEVDFYLFTEAESLYDNIVDAYRKQRNALSSILNVKPVSLDNLNDGRLKAMLEQDYRKTADRLFDLMLLMED